MAYGEGLLVVLLCVLWGGYGYILWRWGFFSMGGFQEGDQADFPRLKVSVLIPARNEARTLPRCLESLLSQTYQPDEIWVINDHSEDGTVEVAKAYAQQHPHIRVASLSPGERGKKAALRLGIRCASGEIILTTDADTWHPPYTIEHMIRPFRRPEIQVVGGWIRLSQDGKWLTDFQRIEVAGLLTLTAGSWMRGEPITANGALLAYRRQAFEAVGGWGDAEYHPSGDDDLLVQRISLYFGSQALAFSRAVVETAPVPTFHAFIQQRLRWLSKRHLYPVARTRWGLMVVGLAHLSLILSVIWAPPSILLAWLIIWALQVGIAWRGFYYTQSSPPPWPRWLFALVLYPIYQVYVGILALRRPPFQWKGRTYTASGELIPNLEKPL
ncbi:MAG: glycosyltransferase [Bacteroidia bacterium]